jgi:uncharacterized protein (DUF1697 family)
MSTTDAGVHVWFLRGINVGGAHSLRMAVLKDHLSELGAQDVRTYIQSGNVVFGASAGVAAALLIAFEEQAPSRYGFSVPVVSRTADELAAIVAKNPFLSELDSGAVVDHKRYHLGLLREPPSGEMLSTLDQLEREDHRPDACAVEGRDIYFDLPGGVAASQLLKSKTFAKTWGGMTLRNWRTVLRTLALAA